MRTWADKKAMGNVPETRACALTSNNTDITPQRTGTRRLRYHPRPDQVAELSPRRKRDKTVLLSTVPFLLALLSSPHQKATQTQTRTDNRLQGVGLPGCVVKLVMSLCTHSRRVSSAQRGRFWKYPANTHGHQRPARTASGQTAHGRAIRLFTVKPDLPDGFCRIRNDPPQRIQASGEQTQHHSTNKDRESLT